MAINSDRVFASRRMSHLVRCRFVAWNLNLGTQAQARQLNRPIKQRLSIPISSSLPLSHRNKSMLRRDSTEAGGAQSGRIANGAARECHSAGARRARRRDPVARLPTLPENLVDPGKPQGDPDAKESLARAGPFGECARRGALETARSSTCGGYRTQGAPRTFKVAMTMDF
ncbi:hypothetical protein [Cupriavidus sp. CuC1]|uniref:hypothetical protein n=1 Tax=Cupriavidus sp. CuC1 TaxID=3373131 RepID=UPI0037CEB8A3